jgi:hypothetical protein
MMTAIVAVRFPPRCGPLKNSVRFVAVATNLGSGSQATPHFGSRDAENFPAMTRLLEKEESAKRNW